MSHNNTLLFSIPVSGIENERKAFIIENALASIQGISSYQVDIDKSLIRITSSTINEVLPEVVNIIRESGCQVPSMEKEFPLLGLSCASCALNVQKALQQIPGVIYATTNYASATALVEFLPEIVSTDQMKIAVQSAGYDMVIDQNESKEQKLEELHQKHYHNMKIRMLWSVMLSIPIVVIGMFAMHMPYANWILWILSTPVLFIMGSGFYIRAWKQLQHRSVNMDTLVVLSTSVAYLLSIFNTVYPQYWTSKGLPADTYFEAVSVIITFILLGNMLEERAKVKTSEAIKKLIGLQPKFVILINAAGDQIKTSIAKIGTGDIILAKAGEQIAVDGIVISGSSFVDESMISGESFPVAKIPGAKVFAGTINQKGSFQYKAEKVGESTLLAQIIKLVQKAQGSRAPVQKFVDKIAGIFVPIVIIISVVSFSIWYFGDAPDNFSHGILAMITVLVIACPCALGLATPTAIMVGIGKGATQGILIKDAEALETARKITCVVLDKTGTITQGKPSVVDQLWLIPQDSTFVNLLYSIEMSSDHPISQAINQMLKTSAVYVSDIITNNIPGRGIAAEWNGVTYYIGNAKLISEKGLLIDKDTQQWIDKQYSLAHTLSYFATDKGLISIIAVSDPIKPTSAQAIAELKKMGLKVYMFTGDNAFSAAAVAKQVGIDSYKAGGLPVDKAMFIQTLQKHREIVAMVGDGINDSGALAMANVSIAMGKGSDIAIDVAKITIISSDLTKIPQAIRLSKLTVRTIKQNLFWAFIYNLIGIPIAAGALYLVNGFLLNPMIAGAAMSLSSVSVVCNSLLLKLRK